MTFRDDRRPDLSKQRGLPVGSVPESLVMAMVSAISGAIIGYLLAGNGYASAGLVVAALAAGWIGWWARGFS